MIRSLVLVTVIGQPACDEGPYGPPPVPIHDVLQEGHLHARGHELPFLCLSEDLSQRQACPPSMPDPVRRSCDSAGCHGSFDYSAATSPDSRRLSGDAAPSCWDCHDREWSERKE